jgi:hypothetical protein
MMKIVSFIFLLFISLFYEKSRAQEIDFGDFFNYSLTLAELIPGSDLDFGTLVTNSGVNAITISNSKVVTITGVEYIDIIVEVTADDFLLLDGNPSCASNPNCRIPFTLEASYANLGQDNISQAVPMFVASNVATAQFPIKQRLSGPPGPPPTPVYNGFDPSVFNETAYVYVFGSVNLGTVNAGAYESTITVTVIYD